EGRRIDHRLVAVVERAQTERAVEAERALRNAEHGDAPAARVREVEKAADEPARVSVPDRVAGNDRDAARDAVGEERPTVLGEEVRLVGATRERRDRVVAVARNERMRLFAVDRLLPQPVTPRREPLDEHDGKRAPA